MCQNIRYTNRTRKTSNVPSEDQAKRTAVFEEFGREIRVFTIPTASEPSATSTSQKGTRPRFSYNHTCKNFTLTLISLSSLIQFQISESYPSTVITFLEIMVIRFEDEPDDDFYEFTADDYYRTVSTKIRDQFLKTRKIREAESAARRARITKAIIRVKFPDNYVLEATFRPSETIQSLIDLLLKAVARPDLPFYLYTTPPKQRIKDASVDFYSAGFAPGAIVYFSYDQPKGGAPAEEERTPAVAADPELQRPAEKKTTKPKWFKM
ncbi:unnamed protein product [Spirodela intermedia]|uniref:UBX domain-containing protein n=1 Tax=Spirodela intermedia TaxID=51605 RepID=A0A7I8J209_SPIIN|nr:unnamed protein product [Spirodela intermedia]CAA6664167.1 unnamed protein product [Spirodela intermedia]